MNDQVNFEFPKFYTKPVKFGFGFWCTIIVVCGLYLAAYGAIKDYHLQVEQELVTKLTEVIHQDMQEIAHLKDFMQTLVDRDVQNDKELEAVKEHMIDMAEYIIELEEEN